MSSSLLRRFWQRISNPTSYVGRDLEGNRYYEYPNPNDVFRSKRVVKYKKGYDMWTYIAGGKRLPVQWTAWLSHTRPHAPTYEELLADIERRRRLLQNVAMIEARDREAKEAARLDSLAGSATPPLLSTDPQTSAQLANPQPRHADISPHQPAKSAGSSPSTQPPKPDPWEAARSKASSDEPQAWSPRAVRRGA